MGKIKFFRKSKLAGALIPYWVITKVSKNDFLKLTAQNENAADDTDEDGYSYIDLDSLGFRINSGSTIEIEIPDDMSSFFVVTGGGRTSEEIHIDQDTSSWIIDTKGGFKNSSYPYVCKV